MTDLELPLLLTVRLKGRVSGPDAAAALGVEPDDVAETAATLAAAGSLVSAATLRLTPAGRERLAELLAVERSGVDTAAAVDVYERFGDVDSAFKEALSQWQLARAEPGSQADPHRDAAMLARVGEIHRRVSPVVAAGGALVPRLHRYADRLAAALDRATAGDLTWLSRPLVDSYHTVWFELHEELIGLAGRTRDDDA